MRKRIGRRFIYSVTQYPRGDTRPPFYSAASLHGIIPTPVGTGKEPCEERVNDRWRSLDRWARVRKKKKNRF